MWNKHSLPFLLLWATSSLFSYAGEDIDPLPPSGIILDHGEHLLCGKNFEGRLQLHDGSQFKMLTDEIEKIMEEWDYYDRLTFSPNPHYLGGSDVYVINLTKDDFIHADYWIGPKTDQEDLYTTFVHHVDPSYGELSLINKNAKTPTETYWQVQKEDWKYLEQWQSDDTVVIGINNKGFLGSNYDYILVNYDKLEVVNQIRVLPKPTAFEKENN